MTVTDERAKQILFSNKIYNTPTRMVAKKVHRYYQHLLH